MRQASSGSDIATTGPKGLWWLSFVNPDKNKFMGVVTLERGGIVMHVFERPLP